MEAFDGDADGHISAEVTTFHTSQPSVERHRLHEACTRTCACRWGFDTIYKTAYTPNTLHLCSEVLKWGVGISRLELYHVCMAWNVALPKSSCDMQDLKEAVLQIYDNRSNLANTLKDTRTIVGKLERLLGICLQLIFVFFYLAIFNV